MGVNIVIGAVLVVVLLFDFVYLPLQRDGTAESRGTARTGQAPDHPGEGASAPVPARPSEHRPPTTAASGPKTGGDRAATALVQPAPAPAPARPDLDARLDALNERLGLEEARAATLERDLAAARDRAARAETDRAAAEAARAMAEAALVQDRGSAADLAERLAAAERDLAAGRDRIARADHDRETAEAALRSATAESGAVPDDGLPDGMPARVLLLYRRGNEAARAHAAVLKSMLVVRGLEVGDLVGRPQDNISNSVTYYYDDDRSSAERIATIVGSSKPVKARIPQTDDIRPGRVDVSVAG